MRPVADLVELCFADTLDPEGERYLQQMRAAADNPAYLRWAAAAAQWASIPLNGFVWEDQGRIIGNISVIPYYVHGRRHFLIANVAVHPDYRRQGIGRELTEKGIEHARVRGAPSVWLHVREENEGAVRLYRKLGFQERAVRTTWFSTLEMPENVIPAGVSFGRRLGEHWQAQVAWLKRTYPSELTWHLPFKLLAMRPGLRGEFYRFMNTISVQHWTGFLGKRLAGVLTWQSTTSRANTLWLAVDPSSSEEFVRSLLLHARRYLPARRTQVLDYPAHQYEAAFEGSGFIVHQTLIWMEIQF